MDNQHRIPSPREVGIVILGAKARCEGKPESDNPYEGIEAKLWSSGWLRPRMYIGEWKDNENG